MQRVNFLFFEKKSIWKSVFLHHRRCFTRLKIRENPSTGILFGVQRYSRYSSPLRNGKDGASRAGNGELVIKEGELGCVHSEADRLDWNCQTLPLEFQVSCRGFRPRWWSVRQTVCGDVEIPSSSVPLFPLLFTIEVEYEADNFGIHIRKFRSVRSVSFSYNSILWNEDTF